MKSQPCPTAEDLLRWLNEAFDPAHQADLATHVDQCGECHTALETLTSRDAYDLCGGPADDSFAGTSAAAGVDSDSPVRAKPGGDARAMEIPASAADGGTTDWANHPTGAQITNVCAEVGVRDRWDTDPDASTEATAIPSAIPSYDVLEVLGEGGMGVVYKARQRGLNRFVALKMIRSGERPRPDHLARIRIEAEAVARLRHLNIVHIYEIGEVNGLPFLSLELLEGGTLGARLEGNPQPGKYAAELMITLARAIQAAHKADIIHRDLKPSNILFSSDGIPKITDFGLAKKLEADSRQTQTGQVMGTPCYMAPEQAMGRTKDVGRPADIYALGAILYEMLTGRPPFKGETPIDTVRQVISDEVVPPSRLVPKVARDLETICLHCLNKEQFKRYRSALELAQDLERFLDGTPIKARRTPLWERGAKLARRRPVATMLCSLALLAILASTGGWMKYSAAQRLAAQKEYERKIKLRGSAAERLFAAQSLLAQKQYDKVEPILTEIQGQISKETDFGDVGLKVAAVLEQSRGGKESEERLRAFRVNSKDAFAHEAHFTGLDLPGDQEAVRKSTHDALEVFAARGSEGSWVMGPLPASLEENEREEIKEGCYELLLIMAEAVEQPEEGLRLLDEAAKLRPATQVFHLKRAEILARRGDAVAADRERASAKALATSSATDHFLIGKEHYKRNEWRAALFQFAQARSIKRDHFWANCLSAVCSLQLSRPVQAKVHLDLCIVTEPSFAWLYELRGFASYQVAALARQASENLRTKGHTLSDEAELALREGEADFAMALDLLAQRPNEELRYALLVNRGLLWLERREWNKAVADLKEAIGLNDTRWQAIETLAQVYDRQGQSDQAIEQFTRAIALQPGLAPLFRARASVEMRRPDQTVSQRERALQDVEAAIRLEPPGGRFLTKDHVDRAQLLNRSGRLEEALAACDAAIAISPGFLDAHRLKIDVLRKLKRHPEVVSSCDVLLARGQPSAELYELRALAKQELDDYVGAIEDNTLAIALRPASATLLARRGGLYLITDAPRSALRDFEAAIKLDPDSPSSTDAYLGRGLASATLGLSREAVADATRAGRLGEPTHLRLYTAARIYAKLAIAATAEARKAPLGAVDLVSRYQDRALELLRQAVKRLPAGERQAFMREVVAADPALKALRHRLRSLDLAEAADRSGRHGQAPPN